MDNQYDIIVAGAGSAGICAAIQAAQLGVKTLLIEKNGICGGTSIAGGVNFPGLFHAHGKQVIAGIGWDITLKSVNEAKGKLPDFADTSLRHWKHQISIDLALFPSVAEEALLESGAEILYHCMPVSVRKNGEDWEIQLACKEGLKSLRSKFIIDCSADANIAGLAGCPLEKDAILQPATLMFKFYGYDPEKLEYTELNKALDEAKKTGFITNAEVAGRSAESFLRTHASNCIHLEGIDGSTSEGRTIAELKGRAVMLKLFRFFRKFPGLEKLEIKDMAMECGIRETAKIIGDTRITVEDYSSGKVFEDSLCYSFYPIDLHKPDGSGIDIRPLAKDVVPTIPLGAMIPEGFDGILAAGRCLSGDKLAHSAFRVQSTCMASGQAAGAAAALAVTRNQKIREVPVSLIKDSLSKSGAIVP